MRHNTHVWLYEKIVLVYLQTFFFLRNQDKLYYMQLKDINFVLTFITITNYKVLRSSKLFCAYRKPSNNMTPVICQILANTQQLNKSGNLARQKDLIFYYSKQYLNRRRLKGQICYESRLFYFNTPLTKTTCRDLKLSSFV